MIVTLHGILRESHPLHAVVDVQGVGYGVHMPLTTTERLPVTGEPVTLFTHVVYREDAQDLYGFAAAEDREFFRLLVGRVSGIGPKIALSILSRLSVDSLRRAIANEDAALLAKVPGIGKKTAERLVIELKDKVGLPATGSTKARSATTPQATGETAEGADNQADAIAALMALGYSVTQADAAIRRSVKKLGADAMTEQLIKAALN